MGSVKGKAEVVENNENSSEASGQKVENRNSKSRSMKLLTV